jgi:4-hydroxybenzoate polyprenyltransferase
MSWRVALQLGRVSNLPTVWSNTLAGVVLAGGSALDPRALPLLVALSLFYVAGMYLNDAFDAPIDARERPDRPIPAGAVTARTVFAAGFGLMALGLGVLAWIGYGYHGGTGPAPLAAGLALGAAIVLYDWHHKANPLSPVLMGACRVLVYVTAGFAITVTPSPDLFIGAVVLLAYLIGLTYFAKQEHLNAVHNFWPAAFLAVPIGYAALHALGDPTTAMLLVMLAGWIGYATFLLLRRAAGDVPRGVVCLIAGIALVDAVLLASVGSPAVAWLAVAGCFLTMALQQVVSGT